MRTGWRPHTTAATRRSIRRTHWSGERPTAAWTPTPHYRLYVEGPDSAAHGLAIALDRELLGAHHYALCRSLGQLGPVRGVSVTGAERIYERACAERGQRAGAIKPPALESTPGWERWFEHDQTSVEI